MSTFTATRHTRTTALCLFAATLATSTAAWAGNPWTRDQGRFYVNFNYATISAQRFYSPDPEEGKITLPDINGDGSPDGYVQHQLGFYSEVGIIDRWLMATFDGVLYRRSTLVNQGTTHGVGDLRLGAWSGLLTWPFNLAVGVMLGIPTGDPVPKVPNQDDTDAQNIANLLPTGDGEWDVEFALTGGYSFGGWRYWPLQHYFKASFGYWLRTTPREVPRGDPTKFPDSFNWELETGLKFPWTFVERFWLIGRVFGSEPFSAPTNGTFTGQGVTQHISYGLELFGRIWDGIGAAFSANGAFTAQNLPAGLNLQFKLSYEY